METTLYTYLAAYIIALIGISFYLSRHEGKEDFLIANRNRKWWAIAFSKFAGAIGIGYFIAYTGYAYKYGLGVYLVLLGSVTGYFLFGLWAVPRIYAQSQKKHFYTQGDFVENATQSNPCKKLTNIISNVILFGWLMTSIIGGAKIISHFELMSYEMALAITIIGVLVYVSLAGFKAVLATDIIQSIIILTLISMLTYIIIGNVGVTEILSAQTGTVDIPTALGFFLFGVLAIFSFGNFYQLVYAAKSKRNAVIGIMSSVAPIIMVATLLLMLGMYMLLKMPNIDPDLVFLSALQNYVPEHLLPAGIVLFFAGLMSSADTNIFAIATHHVLTKKSKQPVRDIRITMFILCAAAAVIGYFFRDVVDVTILTCAMSLLLSVPMIYLIKGGKSAYRFIGATTGSIIGLSVGLVLVGIEPTLLLPTLLFSLIGLAYNGQFLRKKTA